MSHKRDVIGKKFNRLTVLDEDLEKSKQMGRRYVKCSCDCGNIISIASWRLGKNTCNSCGCYRNEQTKKALSKKRISNEVTIVGEIAYIKLRKTDKIVMIDKEDLVKVENYCWRLSNDGYAITYRVLDKWRAILMHSLIIGKIEGKEIDHINQNKLDNRKCNLRHLTHLENMHNVNRVPKSNTGIKNIHYNKNGKFVARMQYNNNQYNIGTFRTLEEAKEKLEIFKRENKIE